MAVHYKRAIDKHKAEASEYLKGHFKDEYPEYLKGSLTEGLAISAISEALYKLEVGHLTPKAFNIELKKAFHFIETYRGWDEAKFYRRADTYQWSDKSQLH
jgi:hypothetical protein